MYKLPFFLLLSVLTFNTIAAEAYQKPETIPTSDLQNFGSYAQPVKNVIQFALALSGKNIGYLYGSANPAEGGMDCSGTIYYILNQAGITEVPRSSDLIYQWVWEKGHFYPVNGHQIDSPELSHLQPGDLLFWSGTYNIARSPNVTHVMMYIGKNKQGQPLMAGASDGRTYKGRAIYGVSVFDFQLPKPGNKGQFLGYSCTPGINCLDKKKNNR